MTTRLIPKLAAALLLPTLLHQPSICFAQSTAFTYQGLLTEAGAPASGLYDFRCQLFDKVGPPGDALVSVTVDSAAVPVAAGRFILNLDFGSSVYNGQPRWLQITVRTNNTLNYTTLFPRQPITATPYAQFAFSGNPGPQGPVGPAGSTGPQGPAGDSHWLLNGSATYYNAGNVGIGTASPAWPLHVSSVQSVLRLDSLSSDFGSVLELRNHTRSPATLGAINFNDSDGAFSGQIAYSGAHDMTFRTLARERMRLSGEGRLDVTASGSWVAMNAVDTLFGVPFPRAIKASSDGPFGIGVLASSDAGTAIFASSPDGYAGNFSGSVQINYASPFEKPHLALNDPSEHGFARLRMKTGTRPLWDIALGTTPGATNTLRFFSEGNGDVVSITPQGTLFTRVLTITGGADIAEPFAMSEPDLPKGAVVVIDEDQPGHLKLSSRAYDQRVAGIISGAGGVNTGLSLSQHGVMEGGQHVALTGRVYVQADAAHGAIKPGDQLTTSETPGHAMKVSDFTRAPGAVVGKAMSGLKEGKGLVLVLVTLQ